MPTLVSSNPASGEPVGSVEAASPADIGHVVAVARAAQPAWAALGLEARAAMVKSAAADLKAAADRIGELATLEMGKPLPEGRGEANHCADILAGEVDEVVDALRTEVLEDKRTHTELHHDPLGVCAAITPWNFPVLMPLQSVIPALVAGNAVILKPSEETPLCADLWARTLAKHLPAGVLQVVHGASDVGRALVLADVDLIVFTGSRATGVRIMQDAAAGLKRVILELGGKDPLVVLPDADLDAAAAFAVRNSFRNAGQVCVSTERIYVHRDVERPFLDRVLERTKALKQGDGREAGINVGPMVNARQKQKVVEQVAKAVAAGAKVLAGGGDAPGNFVQPTVLVGLDHSMDIMREETFGPVACVMSFSSDDEAVRLANDSPYGLGAAVFGERAHAEQVARRLSSGMIGINQGCGGASGTPWVGARHSGYGFHSGKAGHRQFAQVRAVSRPLATA
jgi:succinate-semialdehyde dehydrogenase/glutarate-semialdehyde dehydrogenase